MGSQDHRDRGHMETGYARDVGGRAEQQDAVAVFASPDDTRHLLLVADGMGGHADGARASGTAMATAGRLWQACDGRPSDPAAFLDQIFRDTHEALCAEDRPPEARPGTTLVALYVDGREAHWAHCGDSRLYHFEGPKPVSRTRDHTRVQELLEAGQISEAEMGHHPAQNQLLQALGVVDSIRVDFGQAALGAGSRFLLCSDGFWEQISPAEMHALLESGSLQAGLEAWVNEAARRGGARGDNVAAAACRVHAPDRRHWQQALRATIHPLLAAGLLLLAALTILFWPL